MSQQFTDHQITEAMIVYGGGFVHALGQAFRLADSHNQLKLKTTFAEYWKQYEELCLINAQRNR